MNPNANMNQNIQKKPLVFGCRGLELSPSETMFFKTHQPEGLILFKRNCESKAQIKELIHSFRECVFFNPSILIDQEGGRVQRLAPPLCKAFPSPLDLTRLGTNAVFETNCEIASLLQEMGITVNCTPCLDLCIEGTNPVISDRSFSSDPEQVAEMGFEVFRAHTLYGITTVMKHLIGHGRATADSHLELPVVEAPSSLLMKTDILAFKLFLERVGAFNKERSLDKHTSLWGMSAHIIYTSFDPNHLATHSQQIIQDIIRSHLGFEGILISDCLTMKALKGNMKDRAILSLEAGCDLALHCSGSLEEMGYIAENVNFMHNNYLKSF